MLTVYRASAGAGKTHKLTGEYLKLLFTHPQAYRRILAVTFTNKATDEMKSRIIEELYKLAAGRKSAYIDLLTTTYKRTEKQLRKQARVTLLTILHDYSAFNISTIDRFFQQTMRAFTREIGLQGGYGLEMDQDLVLSTAIDSLLGRLEQADNKELLNWLLRFAEDKIESGGEWSLRRDIQSLAREIFKESYKAYSEQVQQDIANKDTLEAYKSKLYAIIRSVEAEARELGETGLAILAKYGIKISDFKRSCMSVLERLAKGEMKEPTATFTAVVDNLDGCFTKTTPEGIRQIIGCAFNDGLNDCIKRIIALFADLTNYYTAREIVRYYYTLGILTDISQHVTEYRKEKNVMLIADTTELLNKVIGGSDAPFIYEKTGTRIEHYMIDEFQDTSGMQWSNFRPLMLESLSYERDNLIVGDVKQSIYRFRNSDWKLLDEQVQNDFRPDHLQEETLKENWRSCRHIVEFNNTLFTVVPAILQDKYNDTVADSSLTEKQKLVWSTRIMLAYDKCYQQVPPPFQAKEGHVKVNFLADEEEKSWQEQALEQLLPTLERLQDEGYELKDIAILVRTNMEGAQVVDKLLAYKENVPSDTYKYDIISDDALFIGSSSAVRFIIALLQYIRNPENQANAQLASVAYTVLKGDFKGGVGAVANDAEPVTAFSPEQVRMLEELSRQSLYEMTEGVFRLFSGIIPANEQVFVQAFLDMIADYSRKESADITRFLEWWEETGHRKTIATPEGQNAIRILTVHKSKGLGFKVVLLPFCDWEIDHKPTKPVILWCRPKVSPFDQLQLVPVKYSATLSNTIFAEDYFREKLHAYIDNLNTLYVACTRAKEEMVIFAPRPKKVTDTGTLEKINSIADVLWTGLYTDMENTREGEKLISLSTCFNIEEGCFELGNWWKTEETKKDSLADEISLSALYSISPDDRLHLRLKGKGFFFDDDRRKHGVLMHEVLSHIETSQDIAAAVDNYLWSGIINRCEATVLKKRLADLLCDSRVAGWYDGTAKVLNEVDILFGKGLARRPDRVLVKQHCVTVIDYKFGERKDKRHIQQVAGYLDLIRRMGYRELTGYLWYVELNEIVTVNG
ncbi:MAG: UvrD-helicase domain-containing protein [Tannerellaceae bacterium]|nr:UvrD-helicase domain-containing protein [Tannerellaceae bacterium]